MNVKEIVKQYLIEHGYDGLYGNECEQGCSIDDFMPYREYCCYCGDCMPGCFVVRNYAGYEIGPAKEKGKKMEEEDEE